MTLQPHRLRRRTALSAASAGAVVSLVLVLLAPPGAAEPTAPEPSDAQPGEVVQTPDESTAETTAGTTGEAPAAPDRVLVRFEPGTADLVQRSALAAADATLDGAVGSTGFVAVETPPGEAEAVVEQLADDPRVAEVQLDHVRSAFGVQEWGGDEYLDYQWAHLELTTLPSAWEVSTGAGTTIAVLDSAIATSHPEFSGRVLPGWDVIEGNGTPEGLVAHGTMVAGIAAAGAQGLGTVGAAYKASLMPVRVLDDNGYGTDSGVATGIDWASTRGADVINLSLGGPAESPVLKTALQRAVARGSVVVIAAGNTSDDVPQYPAAYAADIPGVLSVSMTDGDGSLVRGERGSGSSWNDAVSIAAPGFDAVGTMGANGYGFGTGTSFAAPFVSGAAALVAAKNPTWTPDKVAERLMATARDAGPRGVDPYFGRGIVDAAAALGLTPAPPLDRRVSDETVDDLPATARPVTLPVAGPVDLEAEGDIDWVRFTATAGADYWIAVEGGRTPVATVLDADGREIGYSGGREHVYRATANGPVYVGVGPQGLDDETPTLSIRRYDASSGPVDPAGAGAWVWSVDPAAYSSGVGVRPDLTVTSRRQLAAGAGDGVRLVGSDGKAVTLVPVATTATSVTLRPAADLTVGGHYELRVTGMTDTGGDVMTETVRSWFTVGAAGQRFTPVDPYRVLDTRQGYGPIYPGRPVDVDLGDLVPADATAVVLNVTAAAPRGNGFVRVFPTPAVGVTTEPSTSSLNLAHGVDQPNLVTVKLGRDQHVRISAVWTTTDIVVDLAGYYSSGGATAYQPVSPVRVMDLRTGEAGGPKGMVRARSYVELQVAGRNGVPADATAVVLNVTGVNPAARTTVRVYPAPEPYQNTWMPEVSNLNLIPGRDQPNLVTVKVGWGGKIRLYSHNVDMYLVADLAGYYTPTGANGFTAMDPERLADTRTGQGLPGGPMYPGVTRSLAVAGTAGIPADATAAVFNVTGARPQYLTVIRVFPTGPGAPPSVSNLNLVPGRDDPNMVISRIGDGGKVSFYSHSALTDLVVDVGGFFRTFG